jgi:hypothetical protein
MSEAALTTRKLAWSGHGVDYLKNEWRALGPVIKADIDFLDANLKGQWRVQSQTRDNSIWLIETIRSLRRRAP